MDCSMPGFPVHHQIPELAQTHIHRVSDTIQPSHPLSTPSPPAFNLSQHQGLFQWVNLCSRWPKYWSLASASLLPMNIQDWSPLELTGWISLPNGTLKSLLRYHSSKASILQHSAFFYGPTLISIYDYWKKHSFDWLDLCWQSHVPAF